MKKRGIIFISLILMVSLLSGSIVFAHANESKPQYVLAAGDLAFGPFKETGENFWCGMPGDDGYISAGNIVSPGSKFAVSICFTAPANGIIDTTNGAGSVKRKEAQGDGTRLSIFLNNDKVFPSDSLWKDVPYVGEGDALSLAFGKIDVNQGDKLYYIVDNGGVENNNWWDGTELVAGFHFAIGDATAVWFDSASSFWTDDTDGSKNVSASFAYKKKDIMSYSYVTIKEVYEVAPVVTDEKVVRLTKGNFEYVTLHNTDLWGGVKTDSDTYVNGDSLSAGKIYATAIAFTAPSNGRISNSLGCGSVYRSGEVHDYTDKTRISVVINNEVVYPYSGVWTDIPQGAEKKMNISFNSTDMVKGDILYYIVDNGGNSNSNWDVNNLEISFLWVDEENPNGVLVDALSNYWTNETQGNENVSFGAYKKSSVFNYHYVSVNECNPVGEAKEYAYKDLAETPEIEKLNYSKSLQKYYMLGYYDIFAFEDFCQPGEGYALGFQWTAPASGRIDLAGSYVENYSYISLPDAGGLISNGVTFKIVLNGTRQIYPTDSDSLVINDSSKKFVDLQPFAVNIGDKLMFILDCNKQCNYDLCRMIADIKFAKNDDAYTETYSSFSDFVPDSLNADAWGFYGIMTDELKANSGIDDGEVSDILAVTYSTGGCGSALTPYHTVVGISVLAALLLLSVCLMKRKNKDAK